MVSLSLIKHVISVLTEEISKCCGLRYLKQSIRPNYPCSERGPSVSSRLSSNAKQEPSSVGPARTKECIRLSFFKRVQIIVNIPKSLTVVTKGGTRVEIFRSMIKVWSNVHNDPFAMALKSAGFIVEVNEQCKKNEGEFSEVAT